MPDGVQDVPTPDQPVTPDEAPLRRALGPDYRAIAHLGLSAAEIVPVALESVFGQGAEIAAYTAALTDFESLSAELAREDHLAFALQVASSENEVLPAGLLLPSATAGALFGLDAASQPARAADKDSGRASRIAGLLGQFLDLLSLTLFTDGLAGTEVTLADLHRGRARWTRAFLEDLARDTEAARIDVVVRLESGVTPRATLILPLALLARLAAPPPRAAIGPASAAELAATPTHDEAGSWLRSLEATWAPAHPSDLLERESLRVSVELGGSSMTAEEILELGPGSVVELNQFAAEPLDILVNDRLIARGEVFVIDEKFGVRITEISSPRQRANAIER